jgi:broad specificity phosphatase PhoE
MKLMSCIRYDTRLTQRGEKEAKNAIKEASSLDPAPDTIISSPLTRALQTADITFADFPGPRIAHSLARERTYFASDVGIDRYPYLCFSTSTRTHDEEEKEEW